MLTGGGGEEDEREDTAPEVAEFWGALVRGETEAAQDSARRLRGHVPLVSSTYSFEDESVGGGNR